MKLLILTTLLLSSPFIAAQTVSFSEILAAQEVLTISPVEINGLPVVGLNSTASKVCKTAGYDTVRSYKFERSPLAAPSAAYVYEESVLKKVNVAGSFAKLTEVVCSK